MWPLNLTASPWKWGNNVQMRQTEAVLESSSNIVMSLSLFSPLGHGIIGTFELARTLNDIEPSALILATSMWLVSMEVIRSFSRVEMEKAIDSQLSSIVPICLYCFLS